MWCIVSRRRCSASLAERKHSFRNSRTATLHIHAVLASSIFEARMEGATEMVRR
jgi:hypothetical protein